MQPRIEDQLISHWRGIREQTRAVLELWRSKNFRLRINGIDITDAEIAAAEARIKHITTLITALEVSRDREEQSEP